MIDIKDISGKILFSVQENDETVFVEELMSSDYIRLSWHSDKGDSIPVSSYIEYDGEKYRLLETYTPQMENEAEYVYSPKFDSRVIAWGKQIVPVYTYGTDGTTVKTREMDWEFTGSPADAMFMVKQAIKNETGEEWTVQLSDSLPATISISSQSASILSVLNSIADECETEWWTDKNTNTLYLSKCVKGDPITLEVGKQVGVPSVTDNSEGYYTRFYAFGSTRNIVQESLEGGASVNKRLTLDPVKYPYGYKDIRPGLTQEEVFVKVLYYDKIYPSSKLTISDVRARLRYRVDNEGNRIRIGGTDEEPVYEQYAIWYFQIGGFTFDSYTIIEGKNPSASFESGQLAGRDFELEYHEKAETVKDGNDVTPFEINAGDYEIIIDESTGSIIPGLSYIIPQEGDIVILFNIVMPEEYTKSAQDELEEKLDKYLVRQEEDNRIYRISSNPVYFYENKTDLRLGQSVTFVYGGMSVSTRIQSVEKRLDLPCYQDIGLGNKVLKGVIQKLKDDVAYTNQQIDIIKAFNELSVSLTNAYANAQREMIEGFAAIKKLWSLKEDDEGNQYAYTNFPIVGAAGLTLFAGEQLKVDSIFKGLPLDTQTLQWVDGVLTVVGGTGGASNWDELEGKPSWITPEKPKYTWSEIEQKPSWITAEKPKYSYTEITGLVEELGKYVTLSTEQSVTGMKDFANGMKVSGVLFKVINGVLTLDCSIAVTGGITTHAIGEQTTATIMDGIAVDGTTITKENGVLKVVGDIGGASNWDELEGKPSWITDTKPTYAWGEITQKPTTLAGYSITASDVLSTLKTVDGSGSGLDADTLDGVHLADIQKKVGYGWTTIYKVNNWSRIIKINGYSNVLLSIDFDQSSQASNHLYLISTGYNTANIIQIGANNFHINYGIKIRVTESSADVHYVEIYSSYGYNGATDISVKCNYLKLDYNSTVTVYTAYTAGGDTVRKEITSSFNKIVSDLQGNADTATIADKLSVNAGSATNPIYFVNGIPVAGTYTFGNAGDNAAINNGILCRNLNADMLDGYHLKYDWSSNNKTCVKLFTIKILSSYVNTPIEFRINGRSGGDALISVKFDNYNGTDPGLISFTGYGIYSGYIDRLKIYKSATSTWEIWLTSQTQAYDSGKIYAVYIHGGFSFTIDNSASDTLPSYSTSYTCSKANVYGNILGNSSTATKLQTARTLWGQSFDGTNNVSGNIIDTQAVKSKSGVWLDLHGANGVAFYTNNTVKAAINTSGNFGIGTTSPSQKLHVAGNILATGGGTFYSSDIRAKNVIESLKIKLNDIANAPVIKFRWNGYNDLKDDGKLHIGGIAQYIEKILPECVIGQKDDFLSFDYATTGYIFSVLTARHLLSYETRTDRIIRKLKERIKRLEKQLNIENHEKVCIVAD